MANLILIRHGKSEWNALGLWTGWTDIGLNEEGIQEARRAGEALKGMQIDKAYTSDLKRAQQTLEEIKKVLHLENLATTIAWELKERNYGDLAGKNKWEVKKKYGEEQFLKWRRSWDYPIPNGETLKDVHARVVPYFTSTILPELNAGENIIIAAHGNSLRALIKYLENISDEEIPNLELGTGEIYVYTIDKEGQVTDKKILLDNPNRRKI